MGSDEEKFKRDKHTGRFHGRHTDLMDVLADYQPRAFSPLEDMAILLGYPGKMGASGSMVWGQYCGGEINAIRDYCETDALNTYLVYLRWLLVNGSLSGEELEQELTTVKHALADGGSHLQKFLSEWV
jgi:hypothetical protein